MCCTQGPRREGMASASARDRSLLLACYVGGFSAEPALVVGGICLVQTGTPAVVEEEWTVADGDVRSHMVVEVVQEVDSIVRSYSTEQIKNHPNIGCPLLLPPQFDYLHTKAAECMLMALSEVVVRRCMEHRSS